jgi:hypothetical protein
MIRIINEKRYNTDTARLIAGTKCSLITRILRTGSSFFNKGDFSYLSEDLYRTRKGAWFLHGSGGPMTRYVVEIGNNTSSGGSEIIPMTEDQAFSWLTAARDNKALETFFSDRIEDA